MSGIFTGMGLQGALVLGCRPGCESMGIRVAGQAHSPSPLAGCAATWWAQSGRLVECLGVLSEGLGRGGAVASISCGVVVCADARYFGREFVPHAEILSFASPKESTQRKGDPTFAPFAALRVPCASRLKRRLRNSSQPCGLGLRQSSPTSPFQPAMLGALDGSSSVVAPAVSVLAKNGFP